MKYNNYILLGIAFTALPVSIQAQTQPKDTTVNRTVIVEQQYNPDIMDAAKVNVLPKVEEPSVSKKEVEYATFTTPFDSGRDYRRLHRQRDTTGIHPGLCSPGIWQLR